MVELIHLQVDDYSLRQKYHPVTTPRRSSHSVVPVVTATQVMESPAPVGSPVCRAYPFSGILTAYANVDSTNCDGHDRYGALLATGYAGAVVPPVVNVESMMVLTMPQVIEEGLTTPDSRSVSTLTPTRNATPPASLRNSRQMSSINSISPDRHTTRIIMSRIGSRSASVVVPYDGAAADAISDHHGMNIIEIV